MKVRVLTDANEIELLASAWENMPLQNGLTPMQEHIWNLSCAETLLGQAKLAIVTVEDNKGLRALAPLVQSRKFPGRYEQLGVRALHEPSNLLYTDETSLKQLLKTLSESGRHLVLRRVSADAATIEAIHDVFDGKGFVLVRHLGGLPYIRLDASVEDIDQLLSKRMRQDLRRARRKADTYGKVGFEIHAPNSVDEFHILFNQALKIEGAGWKGRTGTDLISDARQRDFFRRYGLRAAEKGTLRIAFMRINTQAVAMQFAIQSGGHYWLLKIGYNEVFSTCSPGMLLMAETLRYALEQGLSSYEFLGSSEQWTQRWTRHETPSLRIDAYPYTAKGMTAFSHDLAQRAWDKLNRTFRQAE